MPSRSSDSRNMSYGDTRRGSSRRCYYTNTQNPRRNSSIHYRDDMEKDSMPFRERCERSDRSVSPRAMRTSSPNLRLHHVQTRRRSARSASPNKNTRSTSPRGGGATPFCAETPSSSTGSQVAHVVKPKDFRVPLTCFFWYHTGDCKKSDNKCLYAHYHTGTVAEPPISFNGRAMGGNRAKKMIGNISQREQELSIRGAELYDAEQRLAAAQADHTEQANTITARQQDLQQREQAVQQREQAVQEREQAVQQREQAVQQREQSQQRSHSQQHAQALADHERSIFTRQHNNYEREQAFAAFEEGMLRQLEANYNTIASTVTQMRRAVGNAQGILTNRRQQVLYHENFPHVVQATHGQGRYGGSIAIDGAIGALGGLDQMLAQSEIALLGQIHNAIRRQ